MKKTLQILLLSIFTFTLTSVATATSTKIYNGYVVTINDEKLEGQIEMLSPTLNEVKVKFIHKDGKTQTFKAKELKSYSFQVPFYDKATKTRQMQWITYTRKVVERSPLPFGTKDVLLEQLEKGTVNLYNHFVETRSGQTAMIHMYQVEKNGAMISVTRENFKKALKKMTKDFPELSAKIGKKGYGYKYIKSIVNEYNQYASGESQLGMK